MAYEMRVIGRLERAKDVHADRTSFAGHTMELLRAIKADEVTAEAVEQIVGPARLDGHCDQCDKKGRDLRLVRFGEDPPEWEMPTMDVCLECLCKAVAMLEGGE